MTEGLVIDSALNDSNKWVCKTTISKILKGNRNV